ncbi:MAG: hypothetical protein ACLQOO_09895 [Terriglobia bacterium]
MSQKVRDQIVEEIDRLNDPQQRQLLEFARRLAAPAARPGRDLLRFSGSIDPGDLEAMQEGDRGRLRKG